MTNCNREFLEDGKTSVVNKTTFSTILKTHKHTPSYVHMTFRQLLPSSAGKLQSVTQNIHVHSKCRYDSCGMCRGSSVGIATAYGLDGPGIESR